MNDRCPHCGMTKWRFDVKIKKWIRTCCELGAQSKPTPGRPPCPSCGETPHRFTCGMWSPYNGKESGDE